MKNTAKNIKATLQLFGYQEMQQPWFVSNGSGIVVYPEEAFRADFYVYAICTHGKASLRLNNEAVEICPNSFVAAIPSTIIQVIAHSKDFKAKVLVFERSFLLKNILDTRQLEHLGFFSFQSQAFLQFTKKDSQMLGKLLDNIYVKSLQQGIFHTEIMQSLIFNLLFETAEIYTRHRREKKQKSLSRKEELYMRFIKLLTQHFTAQQNLNFYAQKLFISEKYLIQVCKNISGKTPGALLAEMQLSEAKLLLANPHNNINVVSHALGYSSTAAFSKFFKKQAGVPPSQWGEQ